MNYRETGYLNPLFIPGNKHGILVQGNQTLFTNSSCKSNIRKWPDYIVQYYHNMDSNYSGAFMRYLKTTPVTLFLSIIMIIIWFYCWNYSIDVSTVGIHYESVVHNHELLRIFTASFSHLDLLHIAMNISSLFSLSSVESYYGSIRYFLYYLFTCIT